MSSLLPPLPASPPLVLMPTCQRFLGGHPYQVLGEKYAEAVRLAGCLPLASPGAGPHEMEALLSMADGLLLTGSPSNVHPQRYGQGLGLGEPQFDAGRDAFTLALIPRALAMGLPVLGICRGFQEANVALGGSLHQALHRVPGLQDHRGAQGRSEASAEEVYGPAHEVSVQAGGVLAHVLGQAREPDLRLVVNSVHGQGVCALAAGLQVEALAPDGLVEAFSWPQGQGFNLFVQWHPEWQAQNCAASVRLFEAFGGACLQYRQAHRGRAAPL
jgi:putative glutamine amidotransferase